MTQVLKATGATLSASFYVDGVIADPGTTTVTITRADDTALVTGAATTGTGATARSYVLAPQAALDDLTAVWTGTVSGVVTSLTTRVEIVGGFLFTIAEARAFDSVAGTGAMASTTTYPTADITDQRARITDLIERHTGISWVPRFKRETLSGTGNDQFSLSRRNILTVQSVTVDGTAVTDYTIDANNGTLIHNSSTWTRPSSGTVYNAVVEYEYGKKFLEDGVDRIALKWLRNTLVYSSVGDRTIGHTDATGAFDRLSFPGKDYPTGIPEVDEWLRSHDERMPV